MAKYTEEITKIRKIARNHILKLLENGPLSSKTISEKIKVQFPKNCNESIKCQCGKNPNRPEWRHQVAWAIQDCKYDKQIEYNSVTKKYLLKKL